jgi:hypothetical protein
LIVPSAKENKFSVDDIKLELSEVKNWKDFEKKFRKLKLKFTKLDVPNGNVLKSIFEILHKTRCVLRPRRIVCVRWGYNIYGGDFNNMMEIMRLHYKNKHNQWCKRIDFDQIIRWYRNCEKIPIIGLTGEKKEVIQTKSIRKFIAKEKKDTKPILRSALDGLKKKILTKQKSKTPGKKVVWSKQRIQWFWFRLRRWNFQEKIQWNWWGIAVLITSLWSVLLVHA